MYAIALHDTETEEIMGYVHPIHPLNMDTFDDNLRSSWTAYQEVKEDDYCIEDFIDWHNENHEMLIDYLIVDFIQL